MSKYKERFDKFMLRTKIQKDLFHIIRNVKYSSEKEDGYEEYVLSYGKPLKVCNYGMIP